MAYIINKLKEKGLENKLVFLGYTDPLPYLQNSDVFLFASAREGFANALIEAMCVGLPVICCKIPGITENIWKMVSLALLSIRIILIYSPRPFTTI